jgi:hypothetical protein
MMTAILKGMATGWPKLSTTISINLSRLED